MLMPLPCRSGSLGLMVAASQEGSAFSAMGVGSGGGSGIAQAVFSVASVISSGVVAPWVHVPVIDVPSVLLNLPSYTPPSAGTAILILPHCRATELAGRPPPP